MLALMLSMSLSASIHSTETCRVVPSLDGRSVECSVLCLVHVVARDPFCTVGWLWPDCFSAGLLKYLVSTEYTSVDDSVRRQVLHPPISITEYRQPASHPSASNLSSHLTHAYQSTSLLQSRLTCFVPSFTPEISAEFLLFFNLLLLP